MGTRGPVKNLAHVVALSSRNKWNQNLPYVVIMRLDLPCILLPVACDMTLVPERHRVYCETDCEDFSAFEEPLDYIKHLQPWKIIISLSTSGNCIINALYHYLNHIYIHTWMIYVGFAEPSVRLGRCSLTPLRGVQYVWLAVMMNERSWLLIVLPLTAVIRLMCLCVLVHGWCGCVCVCVCTVCMCVHVCACILYGI